MTRTPALLVDAHDLGPGLLKEASVALPSGFKDLSFPAQTDLGDYGDDDFGVVMLRDGAKLRKFACPTPEAAWTQGRYLLSNWDSMPKVAAVAAGVKLIEVMGRGGLEDGELTRKVASAAAEDMRSQGEVLEVDGVPLVDISGWQAQPQVKTASMTKTAALGNKYSLDTPDLVKTAERYFHQHHLRFHPTDRRTFAVNTVKQAEALGVELQSDVLQKYAGTEVAGDALLHFTTRGRDPRVDDAGREHLTKIASQALVEGPDYLAQRLVDFDEHYGLSQDWDSRLPDPYAAVCAVKTAEEYVWSSGVDRVTETQLRAAASRDQYALKQALGDSGCSEFCKSPVAVFKSLPDPVKKVVARVASTSLHDGGTASVK